MIFTPTLAVTSSPVKGEVNSYVLLLILLIPSLLE
jgi:hypothetical protein